MVKNKLISMALLLVLAMGFAAPARAAEYINNTEYYYIANDSPYLDVTGASGLRGYNNTETLFLSGKGVGTLRPLLVQGGKYQVYFYNIPYSNNYPEIEVIVYDQNGAHSTIIDHINGEEGFYDLGEFEFAAGDSCYLTFGYPGGQIQDGYVRYNCVKYELKEGYDDYIDVDLNDSDTDYQPVLKPLQKKDVDLPEIREDAVKLYVRQGGNGDGSKEAPFGTIEAAQTRARELIAAGQAGNGIGIYIYGGIYPLGGTLSLTEADSGTAEAPVIYQACGDADVILTAANTYGLDTVEPVTDEAVLAKLPEEARNQVRVIDLAAQGTYVEPLRPAQDDWARVTLPDKLVIGEDAYHLSQYPNVGEAQLRILQDGATRSKNEQIRVKGMTYSFSTLPRMLRWTDEDAILTLGKFSSGYEAQSTLVSNIDENSMNVSFLRGGGLLNQLTATAIFKNLIAEIDQPGEYCIDRKGQKLYFYPIREISTDDSILLSTFAGDGIRFQSGAHDIVFKGIGFQMCGGTGVVFESGTQDCMFAGGTVAYTSQMGVSIDGKRNTVRDCDIYAIGTNGINCVAGDTYTGTKGECLIENNTVTDVGQSGTTAMHGVTFSGCGNTLRYNHIYNILGQGVTWSGLSQTMEYNLLERVCLQFTDAGAFYTASTINWGSKLRYNIVRDVVSEEGGTGNVGLYFDNGDLSGTLVEGNIVKNACTAMTLTNYYIDIKNNVFIMDENQESLGAYTLGHTITGTSNKKPSEDRFPLYDLEALRAEYPDLVRIIEGDSGDIAKNKRASNNVYYNVSDDTRETYEAQINAESFKANGGEAAGTVFLPGKPAAADFSDIDWAQIQAQNPEFTVIPVEEIGTYQGGMRMDETLAYVENAPEAFSLSYPANGERNLPTTITLQWENLHKMGYKTETLYIAENPDFTLNTKAFAVDGGLIEIEFDPGKTYYWTVLGKTGFGYGQRFNDGGVYSFSTKSYADVYDEKVIAVSAFIRDTVEGNGFGQYASGAKKALKESLDQIQQMEGPAEEKIAMLDQAIAAFQAQQNLKTELATYIYEDFSNDLIGDRSLSFFTRNGIKDSSVLVEYETEGSPNKVTRIRSDQRNNASNAAPYHVETTFPEQDNYAEVYASIKMETAGTAAAIHVGYTGLNGFTDYKLYDKKTSGLVTFAANGYIYPGYDKSYPSMPYEIGVWYDVQIKLDVAKRLYDVYIDGELLAEKIPFPTEAESAPTVGKMMFTETEGTDATRNKSPGTFCIDNVIVRAPMQYGVNSYLSSLAVNGEPVQGFDAGKFNYELELSAEELEQANITYMKNGNAHVSIYDYNGKKYLAVLAGNQRDMQVYTLSPKN